MKNKILLFIYCWLWWALPCIGAADLPITNIVKGEKGLSASMIYNIVTDDDGYIWLATNKGLMIWDGNSFKVKNLWGRSNDIINIYKKENTLYCFSYLGDMAIVDMHTRAVKWLHNSLEKNAGLSAVLICAELTSQFIFLKTDNKTYNYFPKQNIWWQLTKEKQMTLLYDSLIAPSGIGISNKDLFEISIQKPYSIRISPKEGTIIDKIYRRKANQLTLLFDAQKYSTESGLTITGYARVANDLVVGYFDGAKLIRYRNYFDSATKDRKIIQDTFLTHKNITGVCADKQGNIWVSSYKEGLFIIKNNALYPIKYACTNKQKYYSTNINYIRKDSEETIIGYNQNVIDIFSASSHKRYVGDTSLSKTNSPIMFVQKDKQKFVLFSSDSNTFLNFSKNGVLAVSHNVPANRPKEIYTDDKHFIIAYKSSYFVSELKNSTILINNHHVLENKKNRPSLLSMAIAPDGKHYFGQLNGLYHEDTPIKLLQNKTVTKVRVYDSIVVAVASNGLYLQKPDGTKKMIGTAEGMPEEDIKALYYSKKHKIIYVLTDAQLFTINTKKLTIEQFAHAADFGKDLHFNCIERYADSIFIGTNQGIVSFGEDAFLNQKKTIPIVNFHLNFGDSTIFNISSFSSIYAPNTQKDIKIDVIFNGPISPNISYLIVDAEGEEIRHPKKGNQTNISLGGFEPGKYFVIVKVQILNQCVEKIFALEVLPKWWQQFWVQFLFYFLAIAGIILTTIAIIRYRHKENILKLKLSHDMNILQNKLALSRLKPHFIFNALNPLQNLILKNKTKEALDYTQQFSKLMRNAIGMFGDDYSLLTKELEFLKQYADVQMRRFPDRFAINIDTKPSNLGTTNIAIPSMLLQPLVENAIEHGAKPESNCFNNINIKITLHLDKKIVEISVENIGNPFPENFLPQKDHGLDLVAKRVVILKADTGTGEFRYSNTERGVVCTLVLPLIIK